MSPIWITVIILAILCMLSLGHFIYLTFKFKSSTMWTFLLAVLFFWVWIFMDAPLIFPSEFNISDLNIFYLHSIGQIAAFLSRIFAVQLFIGNPSNKIDRILSRSIFVIYGILIGLRSMIMILLPRFDIFYTFSNGRWVDNYLFFQYLIILADLIIVYLVIKSYIINSDLETPLIKSKGKFDMSIVLLLIFAFGVVGTTTLILSLYVPNPLIIDFLGPRFIPLILVFSFSIYFIETPVLIFQSKGDLAKLITDGVVGYELIRYQDIGPQLVKSSQTFDHVNSIENQDKYTFIASTMTVVGFGSEIKTTYFLIPYLENKDFVAICDSIRFTDKSLVDDRMAGKGVLIYCLIIPEEFLPYFSKLNKFHSLIKREFKKFEDISEIITRIDIEEFSVRAVNALL